MNLIDDIVNEWRLIIESVEINGHRKVIEDVNLILMHSDMQNENSCYKVVFNFTHALLDAIPSDLNPNDYQLNSSIDEKFNELFGNSVHVNDGVYLFSDHKLDYFTNQGHRFIVQFYPYGFLSDIRDKKINQII